MTELAYIAYPYQSDPILNSYSAMAYAVRVRQLRPDWQPVVPHNLVPLGTADDREAIMRLLIGIAARCDHLVMCGGFHSPGMLAEAERAYRSDIPTWLLARLGGTLFKGIYVPHTTKVEIQYG